MKVPNVSIDTDMGIDYADSGAWRSYQLVTHGYSLLELIENASVSEVNQDGGDLNTYSLDDAGNEVQGTAECIIAREFLNAWSKTK